MACTIVATAGSTSANSYITIADADTFFESHLYADDWNDADTTQKCQALQMATRLLDQWFEWAGSVTDGDQALLWPRSAVIGPDGYLEANDTIPVRIEQGTAELARNLIIKDRTADNETEAQGVKRVKAGSVEVEFGSVSAKPIPDSVMGYVSCYGVTRGRSGGAVTMGRG
jgi:hypothetical protein